MESYEIDLVTLAFDVWFVRPLQLCQEQRETINLCATYIGLEGVEVWRRGLVLKFFVDFLFPKELTALQKITKYSFPSM